MDSETFDPAYSRAIAYEAMQANLARREAEAGARPFRFEDLNGRPEPEKWGPVYPKTASAEVEKWRAIARGRALTEGEKCLHGEAVGAWIRALNKPKRAPDTLSTRTNAPSGFATDGWTCAQLRAKIRAQCAAQAACDRLAWATGKVKSKSVGDLNLTIEQVYARAMKEKRARKRFLADCEAFARAPALLLDLV